MNGCSVCFNNDLNKRLSVITKPSRLLVSPAADDDFVI